MVQCHLDIKATSGQKQMLGGKTRAFFFIQATISYRYEKVLLALQVLSVVCLFARNQSVCFGAVTRRAVLVLNVNRMSM